MLKRFMRAVGALALVAALVGATTAFAWAGPRDGGYMYSGEYGFVGVAAEVLEMERADLIAELMDGRTLEDIALEHGVTPDALVDAFVDAREVRLERLVDMGVLTEEELAERLALIEAMVTDHLGDLWPYADPYGMRDRGAGNRAEFGPRHGPTEGIGPGGGTNRIMNRYNP